MKVKIKRIFDDEKTVDLIAYVESQVNGDDYDRGALESAQATADNAGVLLGKLIDVLAAKKVLTDANLLNLFRDNVEKIELI